MEEEVKIIKAAEDADFAIVVLTITSPTIYYLVIPKILHALNENNGSKWLSFPIMTYMNSYSLYEAVRDDPNHSILLAKIADQKAIMLLHLSEQGMTHADLTHSK